MANVIHIYAGPAYWRGEIDFVNDDIKIALLNAHTPRERNQFFSQVLVDEIEGMGYVPGGQSLVGNKVELSGNSTVFRAENPVWPMSTLVATWGAIYKDTGNFATSPLLVTKDFRGIKTSDNAPFMVRFSANGVLRMAM